MVFLHVAPSNTLSKEHAAAVNDYIYPEFEQNWKLFAPDPLQQNIHVEARADIRGPSGTDRDHRLGRHDRPGHRRHAARPGAQPHPAERAAPRLGLLQRHPRRPGPADRRPQRPEPQLPPADSGEALRPRSSTAARWSGSRPAWPPPRSRSRRGSRARTHPAPSTASCPGGSRTPPRPGRRTPRERPPHPRRDPRGRPLAVREPRRGPGPQPSPGDWPGSPAPPSARTRARSYGSASRLTWLLFLLREFPHRSELYGPDSPWGFDLARRLMASNHAFTVLMWSDGRAWFEFCLRRLDRRRRHAAAGLAHPYLGADVHGRRAVAAEPQHLHGRRRRQRHPHHGDLPGLHPLRPGLVARQPPGPPRRGGRGPRPGRRGRTRGPHRRRGGHRRGSRADGAEGGLHIPGGADVTGVALWAVLGAGLRCRHLRGQTHQRVERDLLGLLARPGRVVGGAPLLPRRAAHRGRDHRQHRPQRRDAGDRRRGVPDLLHRRAGTRSRAAAGRTARRSTTRCTWTTSRPGPPCRTPSRAATSWSC